MTLHSYTKVKYKTIVIDPPWPVDIIRLKRRPNQVKMPYNVQSLKEIENFPINDFSADSCDLFMWTTHTYLPHSLEILKKWGFKYHCLITWDKTNGMSILGITRRTEFAIYAYKGKMGLSTRGDYIPTFFRNKQLGHSVKPPSFYQMIRPNTQEPRIDIFARQRHEGFDSWGNEVETILQTTFKELTLYE